MLQLWYKKISDSRCHHCSYTCSGVNDTRACTATGVTLIPTLICAVSTREIATYPALTHGSDGPHLTHTRSGNSSTTSMGC